MIKESSFRNFLFVLQSDHVIVKKMFFLRSFYDRERCKNSSVELNKKIEKQNAPSVLFGSQITRHNNPYLTPEVPGFSLILDLLGY